MYKNKKRDYFPVFFMPWSTWIQWILEVDNFRFSIDKNSMSQFLIPNSSQPINQFLIPDHWSTDQLINQSTNSLIL